MAQKLFGGRTLHVTKLTQRRSHVTRHTYIHLPLLVASATVGTLCEARGANCTHRMVRSVILHRRPGISYHTSNGWGEVRLHKRFTDAYDFLPSEGEPPRTVSGCALSLQRTTLRAGPLAIPLTERIRTRRSWRYGGRRAEGAGPPVATSGGARGARRDGDADAAQQHQYSPDGQRVISLPS